MEEAALQTAATPESHPVALVTGANRGIGLATCVALATAGHTVYAAMRASADEAPLLAAATGVVPPPAPGTTTDGSADGAPAGAVHVVRLDVGEDDSVATGVAQVLRATGGRLDVVVACAGLSVVGNVETIDTATFGDMWNINLMGVVRVLRAVLPAMRAARRGRVVAISSMSGLLGLPYCGPYAASKFALEALFEACSAEYRRLGVRFSLVEPGPVDTGLIRDLKVSPAPADLARGQEIFLNDVFSPLCDDAQTPAECAAVVMRAAVTDKEPALRNLSFRHPDTIGKFLASKYVDVDGAGVASLLSSWLEDRSAAAE